MKDKKKIREFIIKKVNFYKKILFLETYNIEIKFRETGEASATSSNNYPYLNSTLTFNDKFKHSKDLWEQIVIHELIHIHLHRYKQIALERTSTEREITNVDENLTEIFTKIVHSLIKK